MSVETFAMVSVVLSAPETFAYGYSLTKPSALYSPPCGETKVQLSEVQVDAFATK